MSSKNTNKHQNSTNHTADSTNLMSTKALNRLRSPVRNYLIAGCILSVVGSAVGLALYIAIAEIAKLILKNPDVSSQTIWLWVGIGIAGAFLRLALLFLSSRVGHVADAEILLNIRVRIVKD